MICHITIPRHTSEACYALQKQPRSSECWFITVLHFTFNFTMDTVISSFYFHWLTGTVLISIWSYSALAVIVRVLTLQQSTIIALHLLVDLKSGLIFCAGLKERFHCGVHDEGTALTGFFFLSLQEWISGRVRFLEKKQVWFILSRIQLKPVSWTMCQYLFCTLSESPFYTIFIMPKRLRCPKLLTENLNPMTQETGPRNWAAW